MEEFELIRRLAEEDKSAWNEFLEKYTPLIFNHIRNILKIKSFRLTNPDTASDIFQEIILLLKKENCRKLKSFQAKNGCSLATWLRCVTVNFTRDFVRNSKDFISLSPQEDDMPGLINTLSADDPLADEKMYTDEIMRHLKECIDVLSLKDKLFLELFYEKQLGFEQLTFLFGSSRAAVDMRKSRLIEKLRKCFKKKKIRLNF